MDNKGAKRLISELRDVLTEYDNDSNGLIAATRRLESEAREALGGHGLCEKVCRFLHNGLPSSALGLLVQIDSET